MRAPAAVLAAALTGLAAPASAEPFESRRFFTGEPVRSVVQAGEGVVVTLAAPLDGRRRFRIDVVDDVLRLHPAQPVPMAPRPDDILPDGDVAIGRGTVAMAWLAGATRRYDHGVLGDAVEASELVMLDRRGRERRYLLPDDSVFEDRLVRLADVTGDGDAELIVVRAYLDAGAAVAVFKAGGEDLALLAEAAPIGTPYRWLNPVGVADFDGDGAVEIAVVITPHIGGTLALYRLADGRLVRVGEASGFSNHAMGSRELGLSAHGRWFGGSRELLAVPAADRYGLRLGTFDEGRYFELQRLRHESPIVTAIAVADLDGDDIADLTYGLADGSIIVVRRTERQ